MFKVSEDALDFALTHIIAMGDTDILPPAFEYQAIFAEWPTVRGFLAGQDLLKWPVRPARRCLAPKRALGFRVATQLDPLDALLITAVVYEVGTELEGYRVPTDRDIVHSSRFAPTSTGQLYNPDCSFHSFRARSLALGHEHPGVVLMTDIADFFQRIYSHRLENALEVATTKGDHARVIRKFISGLNQSVSYGIPVGPSIFRLLAEITIADVDDALLSKGYIFCRYSDDYRIFVSDEREAREACAFLANTLLHHGLTIQESKTEIVRTADFVARFERTEEDAEQSALRESFDVFRSQLQGQEESESKDLIEALEGPGSWEHWVEINPYVSIDYAGLTDDQKAIVDRLNLWQILREQLEAAGALDIALTRFVLRRIAQLGLQDEDRLLLSDLARLYPVFPQVVQALAVQFADDEAGRRDLGGRLLGLFDDSVVGHLEYHRAWILSVFVDTSWGSSQALVQQLVKQYSAYADQLTRPELVTALGAAGAAHWFRSGKQGVTGLPPWERRAFLAACRCLPRDEAKHWYHSVMQQLDPLEQAIARWAEAQL